MQNNTGTALAVVDNQPNVAALVAGYLAGYREATRRSYTTDLKDWFNWCAQQGLPPLQIQRPHMDFYLRQLEELGRSPATISRRITSVGGWYRWLNEEGIIDKNPVARVKRPRVYEDSGKLALEREELLRLLVASKGAGPVQHALVSLLILNGLRCGEACDAKIEDISTEKGHTVLSIIGKGKKPALIPLVGQCLQAVETAIAGRTSGPILLGKFSAPLSRHQAWRIVMLAGKAAGLGTHVHPHLLRHAFVSAALEAGVPLHDVQDAARHADPRTTQRYNRRRHSIERHATHTLNDYLDVEIGL